MKQILLVILGLIASAQVCQGGDWTYREGSGAGEELCSTILKRLNRYDRNESIKHSCSWDVIAGAPQFKDPPWEELDPNKYESLIVKLEKYLQETPDGYFHRLPGLKPQQPDEVYLSRARDFIKNSGRLQIWHAKSSGFTAMDSTIKKSSNQQTIIRLSEGYPTSERSDGISSTSCNGPKKVEIKGQIVFVTPDLTEPDPSVDAGAFGIISSHDLKLFNDSPVFIGVDSVWRDSEYGLMGYCDFEYVQKRK